jgi:DnaK suppressor protein
MTRSAHYRKTLLAKKTEALASLGVRFDTLAGMGPMAEDDQATVRHDEFVAVRMNGFDHQKLRLIDEALDRLESGDYGTCLGCGEPIPARRLEAVPWAKCCVACQERGCPGGGEPENRPLLVA